MSHSETDARKCIDDLLDIPHQTWLVGAGISFDAGLPLMFPLTKRVTDILADSPEHQSCYDDLLKDLPEDAHVEHILSHLGDMVAIAGRTKERNARTGSKCYDRAFLIDLHARIQSAIRDTIRWGYRSANGHPEQVGTADSPVVQIDHHRQFVRALFRSRRAGLERRPPVLFFTTNYDTLLEDALALERVRATDGFSGGAMAFWEPSDHLGPAESPYKSDGFEAKLFKLHGSIDWVASDEDVVVRRRDGAAYPAENGSRLLIYPQATKYQLTQRDPFAGLFASFRSALTYAEQSLLIVCGYSFGDDHINEEIERALKQRANRLTVLVFCHQPPGPLGDDQGLPAQLVSWLSDSKNGDGDWRDRIVVAGRRGIYHGTLENRCDPGEQNEHSWWSFAGVTDVLAKGTGRTP